MRAYGKKSVLHLLQKIFILSVKQVRDEKTQIGI